MRGRPSQLRTVVGADTAGMTKLLDQSARSSSAGSVVAPSWVQNH